MQVTIQVSTVRQTLHEHLNHHLAERAKLMRQYQRYLIHKLGEHTQEVTYQVSGQLDSHPPTFIPAPINAQHHYEDALTALTAHQGEFVTMPHNEYTALKDDRHPWHAQFERVRQLLSQEGIE